MAGVTRQEHNPELATPAIRDCDAQFATRIAERLCGAADWRAQELRATRSVRSFMVRATGQRDRLLRVACVEEALQREKLAVQALAGCGAALTLEAFTPASEREPLSCALYRGATRLSAPDASRLGPEELAWLLATLHRQRSLGLMRSFPEQEQPTILSEFQRLVEKQRAYLLYREQDGLPQDMLALTLSDLGRVVRRFVVAQEHYFLPHPRRVLCHGSPARSCVLRDRRGLHLYGFENSRIGDGARDLARLAVAARLDERDEATLLEGYLDQTLRPERRFVHRFFAHKVLALLERPVSRLLRLYHIKYEDAPVFGDVVQVLQEETERAVVELATALNLLNDFQAHGRPLAPRDVASMGRLVTCEEYLLRGTGLVIGVEGASYTGKTPVATELAARLGVAYLNVGALLRAGLALCDVEPALVDAPALVAALAAHTVELEPSSEHPHYRVIADDRDITDVARDSKLYPSQERLLRDPAARAQLAPAIARHVQGAVVMEAQSLQDLLPKGARRFTLCTDDKVREQRRQGHLEELEVDILPLAPAPALATGSVAMDTTTAPFHEVALAIIQHCLPESARTELLVPDFTGRRPMYEG